MGRRVYGNGRVLGFFLTEDELIKYSTWPGVEGDPNHEKYPEDLKLNYHAESGIDAIIDAALKVYPGRRAISHLCRRPDRRDRKIGYVIAFGNDNSPWHKDSDYIPLLRDLERLQVTLGLPKMAKPGWFLVGSDSVRESAPH